MPCNLDKYFLCVLILLSRGVFAQETTEVQIIGDSAIVEGIPLKTEMILVADSIYGADEFKPDPIRAIWLGAVIPGYGQIVNRKYWKLPIVYGGFVGCAYAISWNSNRYNSYKNAYLDITDNDDNTNSFLDIIPPGYTIDSYGGTAAFTSRLKSGMDQSRYYRDLSIIISVAYYGLTLIDAFVDAHLYDFDISTDLSMKLRPAIIRDDFATNYQTGSVAYGLSGRIKF